MKSNNCDTWVDNEAGLRIQNPDDGVLPLKKPKEGIWGKVLGSVLVLFIGSGFRKDASFINIGFVRLDLVNGELKYGTEFDSAPFYNNIINLITELRSDVIVVNNNAPSPVVDVIRRFTEGINIKDKKCNNKDRGLDEDKDDDDYNGDVGDEEEDYERCEIEFLPLTTFCQQTAIQNFTSTIDIECCPSKYNGKCVFQADKELYLATQPNFDTPEIVN